MSNSNRGIDIQDILAFRKKSSIGQTTHSFIDLGLDASLDRYELPREELSGLSAYYGDGQDKASFVKEIFLRELRACGMRI